MKINKKTAIKAAAIVGIATMLSVPYLYAASNSEKNEAEDIYAKKCTELYQSENYNEAYSYCLKSSKKGNADSTEKLKDVAREIGLSFYPINVKKTIKWLEKAAEHGSVQTQLDLGNIYNECQNDGIYSHFGCDFLNEKKAFKWFLKAAENGNQEAQFQLGYMFEYNLDDAAEAAKWYRKSAENGNSEAQFSIGEMYKDGRGVKQDDAEAAKWYRKSAENGNSDAQYELGEMYENGKGVIQDYSEAAKWYRAAAEQDDQEAQYKLGVLYENGWGVKQDYAEAARWYRKSVEIWRSL